MGSNAGLYQNAQSASYLPLTLESPSLNGVCYVSYVITFFLLFQECVLLDKCQDYGQPKTLLFLGLINDPTFKTIGQ